MSEWRVIPSFPDYKANQHGEIIRFKVDHLGHRLTMRPLSQHLTPAGYFSMSLSRDRKAHSVRVNRAVCEAFHGPPPTPKHHAAHLDGCRTNNSPENLAWKSSEENEADKLAHGTRAFGSDHWSKRMPELRAIGTGHGLSKLDEQSVRFIRESSLNNQEIGDILGVNKSTVRNVKIGKTWRHVI